MDYKDIIDWHKKYGTSKDDIIKRVGYQNILENVVIAPWWEHNIFDEFSDRIEEVGKNVYNVYGKGFEFSFIEVKNIGAPSIVEYVLPLGLTKCEKLLFIGSAGTLDKSIKIGDLVVPVFSYNGVGVCRYFNDNLEDDFENKYYPNNQLNNDLINAIKKIGYKYHNVINYSVDTIFAQFAHIEHIVELGAKTIEMETSTMFRCADMLNIASAALFCVSDSTLKNKSLYSGRTEEDKKIKYYIREKIIPRIVIETFK